MVGHAYKVSVNKDVYMHKFKIVIPSIFSIMALLSAYYAVLASVNHEFINACYGIILAMIFDSLDGRSARLLNCCTQFGASLDSLVDMMAYGVAPALMMFNWGLHELGRLGYILSFLMCACAGLRLARFNIMLDVQDKRFFKGLSSTMAGGFVVSFLLTAVQYKWHGEMTTVIAAIITLISALLMVSNFKFYSFKSLPGNPKISSAIFIAIIIGLLCLIPIYKGLVIFGFLGTYILINLLLQPLYNKI